MRATRKKVIKTIYKNDSSEEENGDFSDSGSEAVISEASSSDDIDNDLSSEDEQNDSQVFKSLKLKCPPKKSTKPFIRNKKIKRKSGNNLKEDVYASIYSIRNLSKANQLLPSLNLSESGSSDEESPILINGSSKSIQLAESTEKTTQNNDDNTDYKNVWSDINSLQDESEEIAKKTFLELQLHNSIIEETKVALDNYTLNATGYEPNVRDLLAVGEETLELEVTENKKIVSRKRKYVSDSEAEDWEEVAEVIPQQGIQLLVELPDATRKKTKKIDIEMMMKRKINRVKKECQVHMHKVHVLCWLGHGNYINGILNNRELMAAVLSLVPSDGRRPQKKTGIKYVKHITTCFKNSVTVKLDKKEVQFKSKSPCLKTVLRDLIETKVVNSNKNLVLIFVLLLRALGLNCRIMFNFVTLPLRPPATELYSLSTKDANSPPNKKQSIEKDTTLTLNNLGSEPSTNHRVEPKLISKSKLKTKKISQLDGNCDDISDDEITDENSIDGFLNIIQLDGADDGPRTRRTRSNKRPIVDALSNIKDENISPKIAKTNSIGSKRQKKDISSPKNKTTLKAECSCSFKELTNIKERVAEKSPLTVPRKSPRCRSQKIDSEQNKYINTRTKRTLRTSGSSDDFATSNRILRTPTAEVTSLKVSRKGRSVLKPLTECNYSEKVDNTIEVKRTQKKKDNKSFNTNVNDNTHTRRNEIGAKTVINEAQKLTRDAPPSKTRRKSLRLSILKSNVDYNQIESVSAPTKFPQSIRTRNQTGIKSNSRKTNNSKPNEIKSSASRKQSKITNIAVKAVLKRRDVKEKSVAINPTNKIELNISLEDKLSCETTQNDTKKMTKGSVKAIKKASVNRKSVSKTSDFQRQESTENSVSDNKLTKSKLPARKRTRGGKVKEEIDKEVEYSPIDYIHEDQDSDSDDIFQSTKLKTTPKSRNDDRRKSSLFKNEVSNHNKVDIWCEIFDEELRQWMTVDVINGIVTSTKEVYSNASHPVCYVVGWDNNNYLKDLTRKYVPHYNTDTRKLRVDPAWWDQAVRPYLGPNTLRDKEENEYLAKIQFEAPMPTTIGEYKNHPLYALKRHLLKFEAIYPPDAAVLGFVRNEPVYARECVYTCRARHIWYRDHAKAVKVGEKPYKIVRSRPRWDKTNRKVIYDDPPMEIFGPWQVDDYEPPTAENGIVPRNEYGNVELFKQCMLPKGTVHLRLPNLNKVAKKLSIDCATAITGFELVNGFVRPVYDGFVVCTEFEDIITEAWTDDQQDQERKMQEKTEVRVYGHWKRFVKGLLIRERLNHKYGFDDASVSTVTKGKSKEENIVTTRNKRKGKKKVDRK